jgi:hypothetical protein
MTDNVVVKNAYGLDETMRTTEVGGAHTPHHILQVGSTPGAEDNRLPVAASNTDTKFREAFEVYTPGLARRSTP